jgi:hypothetical protein
MPVVWITTPAILVAIPRLRRKPPSPHAVAESGSPSPLGVAPPGVAGPSA